MGSRKKTSQQEDLQSKGSQSESLKKGRSKSTGAKSQKSTDLKKDSSTTNSGTTSKSKKKKKKKVNGAKKGKAYEREVSNDIGHIFPEAQRHLEYQADEEQGLDIEGTDVFRIQCKFRQNYVPINAIREVQIKDPRHIPVLVTKGNHREPMAVLPWKKFVTILEVLYGLERAWDLPVSAIHNPLKVLVSAPNLGLSMAEEKLQARFEAIEAEYREEFSVNDFI